MNELSYVIIDKDFKDIEKLQTLYDGAFPQEERFFTVEEVVYSPDDFGTMEFKAVYDDDTIIGFYVMCINEEHGYRYLQFFAVDSAIRGKGYGGRILSKLLEDNREYIFFASIEKPVPGGENYEIKLRRQQFYEKHGMISVYREMIVNGISFIAVTNKTGKEFDRCYETEMKEQSRQVSRAGKKS